MTLEDIADGVKKKIKVNKYQPCETCNGTGSKGGKASTCGTCHGHGQVTQVRDTMLGRMQTTTICPTCNGAGNVVKDKCNKCWGDGIVREEEVMSINIPSGVQEGMQLSISGKGNAGPRNGPAGDLLVLIEEVEHKDFVRDGQNILHELYLSFPDAALGKHIEVPTLKGKAKIKIDAGTQSGKILRLRGKGLPSIEGFGKGDLLININVWTPTKLSAAEKATIEKLKNSENFAPNPGKNNKSFFEKIKEHFG